MKQVAQLNNEGYFVGMTTADESPLEPGVYLMPAGTVDASEPTIPAGKRAKWTGNDWVLEDIPPEKPIQPYPSWTYDEVNNEWFAPETKPDDDARWDEETLAWIPGPEVKATQVRLQRDQLLNETDWTQVADAPVDSTVYSTYRQALRDIPQQSGFPTDITWPTNPSE